MAPDIIVLIGKIIASFVAGFIFGGYKNNLYKATLYSAAAFVIITVLSIELADKQTKYIESQQEQCVKALGKVAK